MAARGAPLRALSLKGHTMSDNSKNYYIAPNRRGRMIKIVQDVEIPGQWSKLSDMGIGAGKPKTAQALIARFVNEAECAAFMQAFNKCNSQTTDDPGVVHVTGPEAKENGIHAY
jgi:hypothetical protein